MNNINTAKIGQNQFNLSDLDHFPEFDKNAPVVFKNYTPYIKFTLPVKVHTRGQNFPEDKVRVRYLNLTGLSNPTAVKNELDKIQMKGGRVKGYGCFPKNHRDFDKIAYLIKQDPYFQLEMEEITKRQMAELAEKNQRLADERRKEQETLKRELFEEFKKEYLKESSSKKRGD